MTYFGWDAFELCFFDIPPYLIHPTVDFDKGLVHCCKVSSKRFDLSERTAYIVSTFTLESI